MGYQDRLNYRRSFLIYTPEGLTQELQGHQEERCLLIGAHRDIKEDTSPHNHKIGCIVMTTQPQFTS